MRYHSFGRSNLFAVGHYSHAYIPIRWVVYIQFGQDRDYKGVLGVRRDRTSGNLNVLDIFLSIIVLKGFRGKDSTLSEIIRDELPKKLFKCPILESLVRRLKILWDTPEKSL